MESYLIGFSKDSGVRHHPWTFSETDETNKYLDLRNNVGLIRTSLEDFVPFSSFTSVQQFYSLLEWINGPDSFFESNDCAFRPPMENGQPNLCPKKLVAYGRVMVFLRNVQLNVSPESNAAFSRKGNVDPRVPDFTPSRDTEWLTRRSLEILTRLLSSNDAVCVGIELVPVLYEGAEGDHESKLGYEVSYKFWGWGDSTDEVFENIGLAVTALFRLFKTLEAEVLAGQRIETPLDCTLSVLEP